MGGGRPEIVNQALEGRIAGVDLRLGPKPENQMSEAFSIQSTQYHEPGIGVQSDCCGFQAARPKAERPVRVTVPLLFPSSWTQDPLSFGCREQELSSFKALEHRWLGGLDADKRPC